VKRNPERELSKQRYIDSGGKISTKENAALAGVTESRIRTWKSKDKWDEALKSTPPKKSPPKKRGGQKSNNNAAGHGAPPKNKNAETHGAYNKVELEDLPPAAQKSIEDITLDAKANMLRVLRALWVKEADLQGRIAKLKEAGPAALYIEREIEMLVPAAKDDSPGAKSKKGGGMVTAMKTIIRAAAFDLITKLEAELDKTHGRIVKLSDTISAYERDTERLALDRKRHEFAKQKATGEYNINVETGEIVDEVEEDETRDTPLV